MKEVKWIMENLKEKKIYGMKVGKKVKMKVDEIRNEEMKGNIEDF